MNTPLLLDRGKRESETTDQMESEEEEGEYEEATSSLEQTNLLSDSHLNSVTQGVDEPGNNDLVNVRTKNSKAADIILFRENNQGFEKS